MMLSYAFNIYKNKQTFLVLVKKKKKELNYEFTCLNSLQQHKITN